MTPQRPPAWRNLAAACAAMAVFGLALGMAYPLLALTLESRGISENLIGLNAAMMPIGILAFSPFIPGLCRRYGGRSVVLGAAFTTVIVLLSFKIFDNLPAWFALRFLQGMSVCTLFILSEAWIVSFAGDTHRGRIVSLYAATLSLSFGIGPAIIAHVGIEGWTPFLIGAGIVLAGMLPLSWLHLTPEDQPSSGSHGGFMSFARKAPMLLAAVATFAIFDAATLALLPVYGMRLGLDLSAAATALTALILGNVVLQFPIGWLADRFPRRLVLAGCALITALALLALPFTMATAWMWPTLVIGGATGYGVYTVALSSLGDRFRGDELMRGAAAFALMWGSGALSGAAAGGWAMHAVGPHGLPLLLAATFLLLAVALTGRAWWLARRGEGAG